MVVVAFELAALTMVREAIGDGLYDNFVFGDVAKGPSLVRSLGGARLGNMYGTGPTSAPESPASAACEAGLGHRVRRATGAPTPAACGSVGLKKLPYSTLVLSRHFHRGIITGS